MTWLEQFKENYEGRSTEAKSIESLIKDNYKGNKYIPWATMERLTYYQDPEATFEVIDTPYGVLHTDDFTIRTEKESVTDTKTVKENTFATGLVHFVVVKATFLGKTMTEHYPVQDNAYNAPKVVDQNMANKALQRAKAKIASRITGIGFALYEGTDLQFEDDSKPSETVTKVEAPTTGKTIKGNKLKPASQEPEVTETVPPANKTVTPVVETPKTPVVETPTQQPTASVIATQYAQEILDNEAFEKGLEKVNGNLMNTQKFTISREESVEAIATKLATIKTLHIFMKALRRQSGINA